MSNLSLEGILKKHYGVKKPVLKTPESGIDFDGLERKRYLSTTGSKAYEKLVSLLYDLDEITGYVYCLDSVIEDLDYIAEGRDAHLIKE